MYTFREATDSDLAVCTGILGEAFADYEYFTAVFPEREQRLRFQKALIEMGLRASLRYHHVFAAEEDGSVIAAAQLYAPDDHTITDSEYLKYGAWRLYKEGGLKRANCWLSLDRLASSPCRSLPGRVWYLESLAVAGSMQGKGAGSAMLQECILPYVREHGGGTLTLITNAQENRAFYRKNGFEEFRANTLRVNGTSVGNWCYRMEL